MVTPAFHPRAEEVEAGGMRLSRPPSATQPVEDQPRLRETLSPTKQNDKLELEGTLSCLPSNGGLRASHTGLMRSANALPRDRGTCACYEDSRTPHGHCY